MHRRNFDNSVITVCREYFLYVNKMLNWSEFEKKDEMKERMKIQIKLMDPLGDHFTFLKM